MHKVELETLLKKQIKSYESLIVDSLAKEKDLKESRAYFRAELKKVKVELEQLQNKE